VLAAMGLMVVLGGLFGTCGVVAGLVALDASSEDQGGVILGAQVPQKTLDALRERQLIGPKEVPLAYHDATISLDMSDLTFIAPNRVVHVKGATVAALPLMNVTKITHHTEGLIGDVIEITTSDGKNMRLEIAPLNGGESYVNVLEDAWQKHHPDAKVIHTTKR
jgi:hypothetical protein